MVIGSVSRTRGLKKNRARAALNGKERVGRCVRGNKWDSVRKNTRRRRTVFSTHGPGEEMALQPGAREEKQR